MILALEKRNAELKANILSFSIEIAMKETIIYLKVKKMLLNDALKMYGAISDE